MKPLQNGGRRMLTQLMVRYLEFVYHTSKVIYSGRRDALQSGTVALFWHGESYGLYPALKGSDLFVITTEDRRGDYISDLCNHFGCRTLRFPDVSDGKRIIAGFRKCKAKDPFKKKMGPIRFSAPF